VPVAREQLIIADELFFSGTAAEVTPIRSIDRMPVGGGKPGPVTKKLQRMFFDIVRNGRNKHDWLSFLPGK